jgi:hypothetical protein
MFRARKLLALALLSSACAAKSGGGAKQPSTTEASATESTPERPVPQSPGVLPPLPSEPVEPPATPGAAPPSEPQLKPVVASGPPLPEVSLKTYGLHIGGGREDERDPLLRTLEHSFPRFLECYRLVEDPGKEGTFGVDLVVPLEGGRPNVKQPRTAIRGEAFSACMVKAFETLKFKPQRRATAVSYSLKFSVGR